MAKFQGWKKRYSYLDDYKPGMDGKYVYYGRHYILQGGEASWHKYRLILIAMPVVTLALFIVSGVIEAGSFWRMWFVNLTFALKAVAVFLILWKCVALAFEKYPVKKHPYEKSVPWFRPCSIILAASGVICAIAALICIMMRPDNLIVSGCVIEIVVNLVLSAAGIVFNKILKGYAWELDPSEEME